MAACVTALHNGSVFLHHIRGLFQGIVLRKSPAEKQLLLCAAENGSQSLKLFQSWHRDAGFPFGNSFVRNTEQLAKLFLCQPLLLPKLTYEITDGISLFHSLHLEKMIHTTALFCKEIRVESQ